MWFTNLKVLWVRKAKQYEYVMETKDRAEIHQNGQWILKGDITSIKVIFKNLIGENFQGKAYDDYIKYIALKQGFEKGEIKLYIDKKFINKGTIK